MTNPIIQTDTWGSLRPASNNERRALWAYKYYRAGLHHEPAAMNPEQIAEDDSCTVESRL